MSDLKKIGALWLKKKEGKATFMSGQIEDDLKPGSRILVFKNEGEGHVKGKHPDYTIHANVEDVVGGDSAPGATFEPDPKNDDEDSIPF
jgi:hypothetical protein